MADLFVGARARARRQNEGFKEDTGNIFFFFNCKGVLDYHCYYHFLVVFDVVREQLHRQEVENRQDHHLHC